MSKDFSVEQLQSLIECVSKNKIGEFLLETGETKLRIRGPQCMAAPAPAPAPVMAPPPPVAAAQQAAALPVQETVAPVAAARPSEACCIESPIVGTFYAASAPDKEPFVRVGQHVNEGDIVFIVESMKVMNEVPADKSGVVAEILVESGSPVEYGQPVLRLE